MAAYQLVKSNRRITLKLANVYTNSDAEELQEVLGTVIPMILDECLAKSTVKTVRFFAIDVLGEIVRSSQDTTVYLSEKLGIRQKHEQQLTFSYNSQQKMGEILNHYLDRIIIQIITNMSSMNAAVDQINMME